MKERNQSIVSNQEWRSLSKKIRRSELGLNEFNIHEKRAVLAWMVGFATMPISPALSLVCFVGAINEVRLTYKQ